MRMGYSVSVKPADEKCLFGNEGYFTKQKHQNPKKKFKKDKKLREKVTYHYEKEDM